MAGTSPDVIVVGAGVMGSLIAYRLAVRGHRVRVVERSGPCRGATGATFSWAHAHQKDPLFYHRFSEEGVARYRPLVEELGVDIWLRPCFSIRPALDKAGYEKTYATFQRRKREGYRITWLDGDETRRLVPQLSPEVLGTSFYDGDLLLDPFRLVFAVIAAARRHGVEFRFGEEVTGFEKKGDRVVAVRTRRDTFPCRLAVNAAGAQAAEVGRLAGVSIPFTPKKGEILLTEPFPPILKGVVADIRQTHSGNFMIGATQESDRGDTLNTMGNITRLAQSSIRLMPMLGRTRFMRGYSGVRPYPADKISILGPTERCEGFLWATTHSGITLAPVIAEVIADFAEGKRHPCWDDRFSPDRFAEVAA